MPDKHDSGCHLIVLPVPDSSVPERQLCHFSGTPYVYRRSVRCVSELENNGLGDSAELHLMSYSHS